MPDNILQNEATAALRETSVLLLSSTGGGVSGVTIAGGAVLKVAKSGGNFGASSGTLREVTGGVDVGRYAIQFAAGDVDTVGDLWYELTQPGTFVTCQGYVTIRAAARTVDFADAFLTTAKLADNLLTSAKLTDGLLTAAKFGAACITAAKFATDAIDANALKTDASDEVAVRVWAALHSANHATGSMGDQILSLLMAAGINVVRDTIGNGSVAGILTSGRVRGWIAAAGAASAVAGHADAADGEDGRMTMTAVDAGSGLWSSMKLVRTA